MRRSDRIGAIPQGYAACGSEAVLFESKSVTEEKVASIGALPVQELLDGEAPEIDIEL